jgi:hypothetical protein
MKQAPWEKAGPTMAVKIGEGFQIVADAAKRHTMSKVAGVKWRVFTGVRFFNRHNFGFSWCASGGIGRELARKIVHACRTVG